MRRISLLVLGALAMATTSAQAKAPAKHKTPLAATTGTHHAATTPTPEEFEAIDVHGTLPDSLAGTWLMIQSPLTPDGKVGTNTWTVYTITEKDKQWTVRQLAGEAAPDFQKPLEVCSLSDWHYAAMLLQQSSRVVNLRLEGTRSSLPTICGYRGLLRDTEVVPDLPVLRSQLLPVVRGVPRWSCV